MLTSEQLERRAAREQGPGTAVVRAERVSVAGDAVVDAEGCARAAGAERVVAVMAHVDDEGRPRLVATCADAATVHGVVRRVVTDLCVIDLTEQGALVREVAPGVSAREVQEKSAAPLFAGPDLTVVEA